MVLLGVCRITVLTSVLIVLSCVQCPTTNRLYIIVEMSAIIIIPLEYSNNNHYLSHHNNIYYFIII